MDGLIQWVYQQIGCPYQYGGTGEIFNEQVSRNLATSSNGKVAWDYLNNPSASVGLPCYDCSGLCVAAYRNILNIELPRTTTAMIPLGGEYPGDSQLKPGDLLFPRTTHVVMYVGNGKIVEAPQTGDYVKEGNLSDRTYKYWWRPVS